MFRRQQDSMTRVIGIIIGVFFIIMSVICIKDPKAGFQFNHIIRKVEPNEFGLRMTVFSGIIGVILGAVIVVAAAIYG